MWKAIQGDEKPEFIKKYQNNEYFDDDIVIVDLMGNPPIAFKIDKLTVHDFVMDDIVILVKQNSTIF